MKRISTIRTLKKSPLNSTIQGALFWALFFMKVILGFILFFIGTWFLLKLVNEYIKSYRKGEHTWFGLIFLHFGLSGKGFLIFLSLLIGVALIFSK